MQSMSVREGAKCQRLEQDFWLIVKFEIDVEIDSSYFQCSFQGPGIGTRLAA